MTANNSTTIRNNTWDYARGLAIFMIVLHHLYPRFHESSNGNYNSIISSICYTCQLPIFMYISGMFMEISLNRHDIFSFLKKRTIRLLFPYCSFILIWAVIRPENLIHTLTDNFKDGYWFTLVLFEITIIICITIYISSKIHINKTLCISIVVTILTLYEIVIPRNNIVNSIFSINLLWHYIIFFILGLYSNKTKKLFQLRHIFIYAVLYAVSFYPFYYNKAVIFLPFCNLFSMLLLITLFINGYMPFKKIFVILGRYSLQIYLLHFFARLFTKYIPPLYNPYIEFTFNILLAFGIIFLCIWIAKLIMNNKNLSLILFGTRQ